MTKSNPEKEALARLLARSINKPAPYPKLTTPCQLWQGAISTAGYGQISYHGKTTLAHRLSYMLRKGYLPQNKMVLHACDIRNCIEPTHLRLGTAFNNWEDQFKRYRLTTGQLYHSLDQVKSTKYIKQILIRLVLQHMQEGDYLKSSEILLDLNELHQHYLNMRLLDYSLPQNVQFIDK